MKKVSVIVPCYNSENYIDRCIRSLTEQTLGMDAMELIFVNDASTDHTMEHLLAWEKKYPDSIMIIDCEENHRTGGARNIGILHATAPYIGFVDNDDIVEPDMYELLYSKAEQYQCDLVACLYERTTIDGQKTPLPMPSGKKEVLVDLREGKPDGVSDLPGEVWTKIYNRSFLLEHELFFIENLSYAENYWGPILSYYIRTYYVVDRVLYHHIVNHQSIILSNEFDVHKDRLYVELAKLDEIERRKLDDIHTPQIEFDFIKGYYINTLNLWFTHDCSIDFNVIRSMQKEVLKRYPDFLSNPLLLEYNSKPTAFLAATLLAHPSDRTWEIIRDSYRQKQYNFYLFLPEKKAYQVQYRLLFRSLYDLRAKMTGTLLQQLTKIEQLLSGEIEAEHWMQLRANFYRLMEIDAEIKTKLLSSDPSWIPEQDILIALPENEISEETLPSLIDSIRASLNILYVRQVNDNRRKEYVNI